MMVLNVYCTSERTSMILIQPFCHLSHLAPRFAVGGKPLHPPYQVQGALFSQGEYTWVVFRALTLKKWLEHLFRKWLKKESWKGGKALNVVLFLPTFNTFLSWDSELLNSKEWRQSGLLFNITVLIAWGLESPTQLETWIKSALTRNLLWSSPNATYKVFVSGKQRYRVEANEAAYIHTWKKKLL